MDNQKSEIAAVAAAYVVDEGAAYGDAKKQALRQLGLGPRTPLPDNDQLEAAVREHIALFAADTQPQELLALRRLALPWMERLLEFRPYLGGAVWHGTATRHSDIYLHLFCDDSKSAEIWLIDHGVSFQTCTVNAWNGQHAEALSVKLRCEELQVFVGMHLLVCDLDDLRGALRPDSQGRSPRGDCQAVRQLLDAKH